MTAHIAKRGALAVAGLGRMVLLLAVRGYQLLLSPVLPATCRFDPTCSEYAAQAIARHGALRGGSLAVRRIVRCHPWGGAGYDPVPAAKAGRSGARPIDQDNVADAC
ncbi:MAG: membrane protein insertion efficiency factor YidD [Alphaproteobacteria bacterium]|nr:membrane protein insertion efficiency factor YidD [Alphaproteobacteria bacterium]